MYVYMGAGSVDAQALNFLRFVREEWKKERLCQQGNPWKWREL